MNTRNTHPRFSLLRLFGSVVLFAVFLAVQGCTTKFEQRFEETRDLPSGFFSLQFATHGRLTNPKTVHDVIEYVDTRQESGEPVQRITLLSFGWHSTAADMEPKFAELLYQFHCRVGQVREDYFNVSLEDFYKDDLIIAVTWDAKASGLGRTLSDLIPSRPISNVLEEFFSYLLLPLSFWAKSELAETIAARDLRDAIHKILEDGFDSRSEPDIYLIGHSFGARILASFSQEILGLLLIPDEIAFNRPDLIKGQVLVLPVVLPSNQATFST